SCDFERYYILLKDEYASLLKFVDNPEEKFSEEILEKFIEHNVYEFIHINNPSIGLCKFAVSKCGSMLKYFKDEHKTPELCEIAIMEDTSNVRYVPQKYEEIIKSALEKKHALSYIYKPSFDIIKY